MTEKKFINGIQRKHLRQRIEHIEHACRRRRWEIEGYFDNDDTKKRAEPAEVKRARKLVKDYAAAQKKKLTAEVKRLGLSDDAIRRNTKTAHEKLLFSSPEEALQCVRDLERLYPFANEG